MKSIFKISLAIASLALAGHALAQVDVSQAWVRATVAQQKATGAFLQLKAKRDSRLVFIGRHLDGEALKKGFEACLA